MAERRYSAPAYRKGSHMQHSNIAQSYQEIEHPVARRNGRRTRRPIRPIRSRKKLTSQNVRLKAPLLSRQWLHPRQLPRRRQLSRQQLSRKTPVKPSMRANAPAARIGRLTRPPVKFPPERSGRNIGVTATSARRLRECSGHCCFHHLQRACPLWVKSGLMHCSNGCPLYPQ